jgi:hypothetical protein
MTDHKFTPGPWRLEHGLGFDNTDMHSVKGANGDLVCDNEHYYPHGVSLEDARLIAASPDLLAACEAALYFHEEQQRDYGGLDPDLATQIERVKAAIAKALGKSK